LKISCGDLLETFSVLGQKAYDSVPNLFIGGFFKRITPVFSVFDIIILSYYICPADHLFPSFAGVCIWQDAFFMGWLREILDLLENLLEKSFK
jgi:hypothetical protein